MHTFIDATMDDCYGKEDLNGFLQEKSKLKQWAYIVLSALGPSGLTRDSFGCQELE